MLQRICIVILSRDSGTINDVVKAMVQETPYAVWILDDGSSTPVRDALYSWDVRQAIEAERVRVLLSDDIAATLPTFLREGYTHMATVSASASARARDVKRLVAESEEHPFAIVIGRLANGDLETSFALYPLFEMQNFRAWSRFVPFVGTVLAEARARGVAIRHVEIAPLPGEKPASPANRWIWRTASFLGGLFRPPQRAADRAMALAVGAGLGVLASQSLAVVLAIVVATILRLRLTWIALSWVVTAFGLQTFTLLGSIYLGQKFFNIPFLSGPEPHMHQWQIGSVALGLLTAVAVFLSARSVQAVASYLSKKGFARIGEAFLRHLPDGLARIALWFYLPVFMLGAGFLRRELVKVRRFHFSGESFFSRWRKVLFTLYNAASFQMDRIRLEISFAPEAAYPGAQLVTAQVGNWPWLKGRARIIDAVNEGAIELIPFMGRLVAVDVTPFIRAAENQIPVRFCYFVKGESSQYEWIIREPRLYSFTPVLAKEWDAYIWARDFIQDAENIIERYPEQYLPLPPTGSKCPTDLKVKTWTGPTKSLTRMEPASTLL